MEHLEHFAVQFPDEQLPTRAKMTYDHTYDHFTIWFNQQNLE